MANISLYSVIVESIYSILDEDDDDDDDDDAIIIILIFPRWAPLRFFFSIIIINTDKMLISQVKFKLK